MSDRLTIEACARLGSVTVCIPSVHGHIRFRMPESVNVASVSFEPPGTCIGPPSTVTDLPLAWKRGPETVLLLGEHSGPDWVWEARGHSDITLCIHRPGLLDYAARVTATEDSVVVEATLQNISSWDWRDAYVYFCCGVDPMPAFTDLSGRNTFVVTSRGLTSVGNLRQRIWRDFRPTAQYYEVEGRPMSRIPEGFAFDECGISPDPVVAGIILRQRADSDAYLAVTARQFRALFMDLLDENNCLHANPFVGDLCAGHSARLRGSIHVLRGSREHVLQEAAARESIPLP